MKLLDRILNDSKTNVEKTLDEEEDVGEYPKYSSRDIQKTRRYEIDAVRIHFKDGTTVEKEGFVQKENGKITVSTLKDFQIGTFKPVCRSPHYVKFDAKTVFETREDLIKYTEVVNSKDLQVTVSANLNYKQEAEDKPKKLNSVTQQTAEKKMVDADEEIQ